ncbi:MAG: MASE3 domain-containing protein, partial [Desulfuromonadaceae bacterium]|nr:MASE3 domain-containing protein [Desulfuromonadaceae bacterium]
MPTKHASHESHTWKRMMLPGSGPSDIIFRTAVVMAVALGLYASSLHSYILFHSLIEFTTIAIGFTLFTLTWNARRFLTGGCLKVLGIGYGLIALVDLLHSLAYKGMGVFPGYGANLPTQLWIEARSLQALLLCLAPLFARRNLNERIFFGLTLSAVSASTMLVYSGVFPDCFIEGTGLTTFKIVSEYVISAFLLVALFLFVGTRTSFNIRVFTFIAVSILCTIGSELAFTSYVSVYGPANMAGHFLKLAAFYLIYRALVVTGFQEPFDLIFRDLKRAEQAVTREKEFSHSLLDSMADGVVACDAGGTLTLFNRSAREWHGLDPLRLPPEEWAQHFDLFHPDGITPLLTDEIPLARAFRGEIVRDAGMAIKAKGQPVRFILANGSVILDETGQKLGAVAIMHDVTEFRRLEQELRKANEDLEMRVEERTEELRKTAGDLNEAQRIAHIGSWELDLLTNRLFWSDEIYRIFEIDPQAFGASYDAFLQAIHPDDREAVDAAYTNSVRTRTSYSIDHRLLLAGGRIKHVHEHCETFYENDKPIRSAGTVQDITERKRIEEERSQNLRYFENMDRVNRAIQGATDLEGMLNDLLDVVLATFDCDRAFLLYPCDPKAGSWGVPVERCKAEYPGVLELGIDVPTSSDTAQTFRTLLEADGPVQFGPGTQHPLPVDVSARFGFKSFISMALRPKIGSPWEFGLHQCSRVRHWTAEEERLFREIARRLADGLDAMLAYRDLQESEQRFRLVFKNSPVSIWEEDFSGVKALLDGLKQNGVTEIEVHFEQHPEIIRQCAQMVKIVDMNEAALALHCAANKDALLAGLTETFTAESFDTFREELICIWNGTNVMVRDAVVKTLTGEQRDVTVYFAVCPGYEKTLDKVIVSLVDITERKHAEKELHLQTIELEEEVAERQMTEENLQEKALLLEEEIEKRQKAQDELERLNESLEERV